MFRRAGPRPDEYEVGDHQAFTALIVESLSAFIEREKANEILGRALRDAKLRELPRTRAAVREFVHLRVYPRVADFAGITIADALLNDLEPVLRGRTVASSGVRGSPSAARETERESEREIDRDRTSTPLDLVQKPVLLVCSHDPAVAQELTVALAGRVMVREIGDFATLARALAAASSCRIVVLAESRRSSLDLAILSQLESELPVNAKCVVWSRDQGDTLPHGLAPLAIHATAEELALDLIAYLCDER